MLLLVLWPVLLLLLLLLLLLPLFMLKPSMPYLG